MSKTNEVRLIDANALCAILEAKADMALVPEYKHAFLNVQAMVNAMPTLDVIPMDAHRKCMEAEIKKRVLTEKTNQQILENYAPVVHAKWIQGKTHQDLGVISSEGHSPALFATTHKNPRIIKIGDILFDLPASFLLTTLIAPITSLSASIK